MDIHRTAYSPTLNIGMKNFTAFVKEKKDRFNHFSWVDGEVEFDHSLQEWTADKPLVVNYKRYRHHEEPHDSSDQHKSFMNHHNSLSQTEKEHRNNYKSNSYPTNRFLRTGRHDWHSFNPEKKGEELEKHNANMHDHIQHLDKITSHRIEHHHVVFRGGVPKDVHKFPAGHKFQDHGYTGTSFRHDVATGFTSDDHKGKHDRSVMHVIHVPKGTKGHYFDVARDTGISSEHELVLHRGTKFKVTHHSHDGSFHYIHSRVVGQHPKKLNLPAPVPGKEHSLTGYMNKFHGSKDHGDGVVMTKHDDEKNPDIKHKIKIHMPPQSHIDAAKAAAKKHKIASSMEKAKHAYKPGDIGFHSSDSIQLAHHKKLLKKKFDWLKSGGK